MKALLEADQETLLDTMSLALWNGQLYNDSQRMLMELCAKRFPEEAIARLDGKGIFSARAEAAWQVWSVVAKTDPERALAAAQAYFDPKNGYYRSQLQTGGVGRPIAFIARAVGRQWMVRDGVTAIKKLGTLPHADDMDGKLLEGMCEAASTPDECLALLSWFIGPGSEVSRFQKGFDPWWQRPLKRAASQDIAKARAWVEHAFPAKTKRKSNASSDWDGVDFRRVLFYAWAQADALPAAVWYAAQYADDDSDAEGVLLSCVDAIANHSPEGMPAGLWWFESFIEKPHFIAVVASLLNSAGENRQDDTELRQVATWIASLSVERRERILIASRKDWMGYRVPFPLSMENKALMWCCPNESERRTMLKHLKAELKSAPSEGSSEVLDVENAFGNEFRITASKFTRTSAAEAIATAKLLAAQYKAAIESFDPQERLAGMPALDWLAVAPTAKLREVLLAHLEGTDGKADGYNVLDAFVAAILATWTDKDWTSCEQFAWDAAVPVGTRRMLLVETFKSAAQHWPDEVYARLTKLSAEGRFWAKALISDGSDVQCGGDCYMGYVPQRVGAAWIKRDKAAAIAQIKKLPPEWRTGAIKGAIESFDMAGAGLALLDWAVEQDASAPKSREESRRMNLSWSHLPHARTILSRLVEIDVDAARRWLEADVARLTKTRETFDGVYEVSHAMLKRDPIAAAAWLQRVRPGEDMTWSLVQQLIAKDEALALEWIASHSNDAHIDSAYTVMVDHWEIAKPADAATMVAKMSKGGRTRRAAHLYQSWSRLDEKAAKQFLDSVIGLGNDERKEIDKEIVNLEKYAFDRRK